MQITIEVADNKADFVLELLKSLPFVDIQSDKPNAGEEVLDSNELFFSKTARLLDSFPQLANRDNRKMSIQAKHLK